MFMFMLLLLFLMPSNSQRLERFWRMKNTRVVSRTTKVSRKNKREAIFLFFVCLQNKIWREILELPRCVSHFIQSIFHSRVIVFTKSSIAFISSQLSFFDVLARRRRCAALSSQFLQRISTDFYSAEIFVELSLDRG